MREIIGSAYKKDIIEFIQSIGIRVIESQVPAGFLPGILIDKGEIVLDESQLLSYGDLLHEAGHIALMTSEERDQICGNVKEYRKEGFEDELGVILWSYAALQHLKVPIDVVFHANGLEAR